MESGLLHPDFVAFLKLLEERGVRYLVIGGYAVCAHGNPRPTKDLDVWVAPDEENVSKTRAVVEEFLGNAPGLERFGVDKRKLRMGVRPVMIEVLLDISGVDFESCYPNRQPIQITEDFSVPFIGRQDLLENKRSSGRPRDLADVADLTDMDS